MCDVPACCGCKLREGVVLPYACERDAIAAKSVNFFQQAVKNILLEEMMMNKLIIVVLAFAIATPALADDLIAPAWRGDPGSTY